MFYFKLKSKIKQKNNKKYECISFNLITNQKGALVYNNNECE